MSEVNEVISSDLRLDHAVELAQLVDLEARWENLREKPLQPQGPPSTGELHGKQKAYEAFHAKLVAYNKRFSPAHLPELLLNTPARLGKWCRTMRDLYRQVENDAKAPCPVHLVDKAFRWADRVAQRVGKQRMPREGLPSTTQTAIRELDDLAKWCDALAGGDRPD